MIEIIPFGEVNRELLEDIRDQIQNIFGLECKVSDAFLKIPLKAYHEVRRQYDSRLFLATLNEYALRSKAQKVLGITDKDLFTEALNFVFGQAFMNGKVCVISVYRLDPKLYCSENRSLFLERAVKESVHELGHCYGLNHCNNKRCVMVFSNTIYDVDKKSSQFCERCKRKL